MAMTNFKKRVLSLQSELKVPKGQFNKFGNYSYRSCEDILEAAKAMCSKYDVILTLSDEIVNVGGRFYVKATAMLKDTETEECVFNTAYAREAETKKGMDESQITGAASSYARKYALNGLLCIDDNKDADTPEYSSQQTKSNASQPPQKSGYTCKTCGREVKDYPKADGSVIPAAEVYRSCGGMCTACYRKAQQNAGNETK